MPHVVPWMSDVHIEKGERWSDAVGKQLSKSDFGVCCVTPENTSAPWLLFEAGAISKSLKDARVFPVLLGLQPSDLRGPLTQFQATVVEQGDMLTLLRSMNRALGTCGRPELEIDKLFNEQWPHLERMIETATGNAIEVTPDTLQAVISVLARHGLSDPVLGTHAYFAEGFESHGLYDAVFKIAQQRLYILGRKNRKVFEKDHRDFHDHLATKLQMGFDFRCLFMDPAAPVEIVGDAHADGDFPDQLATAIEKARKTLDNSGVTPSRCCRTYRKHRTTALIVVDNAVLFKTLNFGASGHVEPLTKTSFNAVSASSSFGQELIRLFVGDWESSSPLK